MDFYTKYLDSIIYYIKWIRVDIEMNINFCFYFKKLDNILKQQLYKSAQFILDNMQ